VQIIETTRFGVRSSVITLGRAGTPLKFVLFPMIHIAEPTFYQEVTTRLKGCDLVGAEGIGRSSMVTAVTLAYRIARFGRSGLVLQRFPLERLGVPIVNPDMTGGDFDAAWSRLPLTVRLTVAALFPPVLLAMLLLGTRRFLASQLRLDDLPSREELLRDSELLDHVDSVVVHKRDARLVKALSEIHERRSSEPIRVAVVYGAGHVPALARYMGRRYGYWPQRGEWLTVFRF
jgi:hypothetical protein